MSQLRIALPPLAELELDSPLHCAWLDRQGQVSREECLSLNQLSQSPKQPPLVCFLHPADSLLASHRRAAAACEQDGGRGAMRRAGVDAR